MGLWGWRGFLEATAVGPVRVWLHLERGLRVVSFEVLPLRTESMGNSTAHLSCPNLILQPGCQFGVRGRFRETASRLTSLHLICLCLSRWSDDRESEWREMEGTKKWRSRKRSADSENDEEEEERRMTNYSLSAYGVHPFRKEKPCLLTLLSKYARLVRLCMPEKMMGGV